MTTIRLRRDTAANWTANGTVVLAAGEPGLETDTGKIKYGNGSTTWANLAYAGVPSTLTGTTLTGYNEGSVYDLGTTGGTVAPNASNGNVQKITLNSALTINAFTSPVAGQSITLIIYGGTSYTAITSTMKFSGGLKALTATSGCIDIVSIFYDGSTYFASIGKGFA
jgi:hypothetical protein